MGTIATSGLDIAQDPDAPYIQEYVDRYNRPGVNKLVGLEAHFIQDGEYVDPLFVSGVTLVPKVTNVSPSSILAVDTSGQNLINPALAVENIAYFWGDLAMPAGGDPPLHSVTANEMQGHPTSHGDTIFGVEPIGHFIMNAHNFADVSGVYRTAVGKYIVFLNGISDPSAIASTYYLNGSSVAVPNRASGAGEYLDVWTVTMPWETSSNTWLISGSPRQVRSIVQEVTLYEDLGSLVVATEPIMFETKHKLLQTKVQSETKVNLEVTTEIVIKNRTLDEETKNILKSTAIQNFEAKIQKVGNDQHPTHTIKDYTSWVANESAQPWFGNHKTLAQLDRFRLTHDNTLVLPCDFTLTGGHMIESDGAAYIRGTTVGTWRVKVRYNMLGQKFRSPWMYFEVVGD